MFGCPAAFVGSHLAFCVYGSGIGIKLPADKAAHLVENGRAFAFQPYGRSAMREWVEVRITRERVADLAPVLIDAIEYARDNLHGEPPGYALPKNSDSGLSDPARSMHTRAKR
jgi:hypothetical protein